MPEVFTNALRFLVQCIFDLYIFVFVLRLILVWAGVNYWQPITQLVVKMTDFVVKPVRKIIPNVYRIETASVVIIIVLELIKYTLLSLLSMGIPNFMGILIMSVADMLHFIIQVFFYSILLYVILSWVQPASPINHLLVQITNPILKPFQRLLPPINGIDLSAIPALIVLQLLGRILVEPLRYYSLTFF